MSNKNLNYSGAYNLCSIWTFEETIVITLKLEMDMKVHKLQKSHKKPVHVFSCLPWRIILNNTSNFREIQASCRNVCGQEESWFFCFKCIECSSSVLVIHVSMQSISFAAQKELAFCFRWWIRRPMKFTQQ